MNQDEPGGAVPRFAGNLSANWKCEAKTMVKLKLIGDISDFVPGIEALKPDLPLCFGEDGIPVTVEKGDKMAACLSNTEGKIVYGEKVQFFRALSYFAQCGTLCSVEETPCFKKNGIMFDMSRNAVMKPETVKFFLRKMALMGLNLGMMYTEETYQVEGYPYFGYLRGAYSQKELRDLDDYAYMLGIELVPCIQTLGHLERALHWEAMAPLADTASVLMVGEEETYRFIETLIKTASAPYRSNRIHIGMDEAFDLGLGNYLKKNGYTTKTELMVKHLARVSEILRAEGLEAMMWSDMFFSMCSPTHSYRDLKAPIPQEVLQSVPDNISLVYWHYSGIDENAYRIMIERHKLFPNKTVFAGGLSTWIGPVAKTDIAIAGTQLALRQCKLQGIDEVFATAWGDNGAECNLLAALYGLQVWAEMGYRDALYEEQHTKARFLSCVGADAQAFLDIAKLDAVEGVVPSPNVDSKDPCKYILYQDPMFEIFQTDSEDFVLSPYYAKMAALMERHRDQNPDFSLLFDFYAKLSAVMEKKCLWHENATRCVREKDRVTAQMLCGQIPEIIARYRNLLTAWETLWFSTSKPYGFDVIEQRLGGVIARFETAAIHMAHFAAGETDTISGLCEEKLPYESSYPQGHLNWHPYWDWMVSNNYVGIRD